MSSTYTQLILLTVTLFSLTFDDYRLLFTRISQDPMWDIAIILCLAVFLLEILFSCILVSGYFNSYFFYLDIISSASLVLDYSSLRDILTNVSQIQGTSVDQISKFSRLIRLVRLVRISKIYKSLGNENKRKVKIKKSSKVGKELGKKTTKSLIIICFIMLIFMPIFTSEFWLPNQFAIEGLCFSFINAASYNFPDSSEISSFSYLDSLKKTLPIVSLEYSLQDLTSSFISALDQNQMEELVLIEIKTSETTYFKARNYEDYRLEEKRLTECQSASGLKVRIEQADISNNKLESVLDLIRALFISILLIGGTNLFSRSTHRLVIRPIENMIEKITKIIEKPQRYREIAFIEQEKLEEEKLNLVGDGESGEIKDDSSSVYKMKGMETQALEESITNIGILLGVVFGEAGTNLIGRYLGSEGDVNVMVEGDLVEAIYGFCDIRNFTDATEVLQQEVMVFVNTVAQIVHSLTDQALGNANKNVGDAFLLVWKMTKNRIENAEFNGVDSALVYTNLADLALYSIMKIFAEISRSFTVVKYVNNQGLKQRIGKNYKVRLGFGLHLGWSVEGGIGSHHKIDVSYLSANVNKAGKLESMCKAYGCVALLSGEFYDKISRFGKKYTRQVDCIIENGNSSPFRVFCLEMSDKAFRFPSYKPLRPMLISSKESLIFKRMIEREMASGIMVGQTIFENDVDISMLTCHNPDQLFLRKYQIAFNSYLKGEFRTARILFGQILETWKDGPSEFLLKFVSENIDMQKLSWKGGRPDEDGH